MASGFALNRSRQAPAEDTPAFGGVAERFRRAGDLDRAIALCREGLKKFPNQLSARVTLGWSLLDQGKYDEARAELEQVLRRAPDNLAAIRGLAELHEREENAESQLHNNGQWQPAAEPAKAEAVAAPAPEVVAAAEATVAAVPEAPAPIAAALAVELPVEIVSPVDEVAEIPAAPVVVAAAAPIEEPPQFLNAQGMPAFDAPPMAPVAPAPEPEPEVEAAVPLVAAQFVGVEAPVAAAAPVIDLVSPAAFVAEHVEAQAAAAATYIDEPVALIAEEPVLLAEEPVLLDIDEPAPFVVDPPVAIEAEPVEFVVETPAPAPFVVDATPAAPVYASTPEPLDLGLTAGTFGETLLDPVVEAPLIDLNAAMLDVSAAEEPVASLDVDLNAPMFSGSELVVEPDAIVFDEPVVSFSDTRTADSPESTFAAFEHTEPEIEAAVELSPMDTGLADMMASLEDAAQAEAVLAPAIDFSAPVQEVVEDADLVAIAEEAPVSLDLTDSDLMPAQAVSSATDLDVPLMPLMLGADAIAADPVAEPTAEIELAAPVETPLEVVATEPAAEVVPEPAVELAPAPEPVIDLAPAAMTIAPAPAVEMPAPMRLTDPLPVVAAEAPAVRPSLSSIFSNTAEPRVEWQAPPVAAEPEPVRPAFGLGLGFVAPRIKTTEGKSASSAARVAALERLLRKVAARRAQLATESVA